LRNTTQTFSIVDDVRWTILQISSCTVKSVHFLILSFPVSALFLSRDFLPFQSSLLHISTGLPWFVCTSTGHAMSKTRCAAGGSTFVTFSPHRGRARARKCHLPPRMHPAHRSSLPTVRPLTANCRWRAPYYCKITIKFGSEEVLDPTHGFSGIMHVQQRLFLPY
jgi:hypothetical protein